MALRAQKVSGAFKKWAPVPLPSTISTNLVLDVIRSWLASFELSLNMMKTDLLLMTLL